MSKSVLYMSMSLDGFITAPGDDAEHGPGIAGEPLHAWLGEVFGLGAEPRELELTRVVDAPGVARLHDRVKS